ncbi:carboxypeptidase-like regulatory domain-containing protein [Chitinophaga solisilvae]|uniref:carboxypeptidase-like regulatory domain-containing protein n=1 Tax=Chitinophaga solisilvae TaxID=1233460 RepID=UPI001368D0FC|nr:carboxypeptidase-like regulatory domain-containing protein [Chitinophaga solisilvae]
MTPAGPGRFCDRCRKTVVDFSTMNDREILSYLQTASGVVCGNFHPSQVNRHIMATPPVKRRSGTAALLASLLALIVPGSSRAQQTVMPTMQTDTKLPGQPAGSNDTTAATFLTGAVRDSANGTPVYGATVLIAGTGRGTHVDNNGNFRLRIPDEIAHQAITLQLNAIGYQIHTVIIPYPFPAVNTLYLPPGEVLAGEVVITGYHRRKWYQIFRRRH